MENSQARAIPMPARVYIALIGLAGTACVLYTFHASPFNLSPRFALYLIIAMAGAGMRVSLPGVFGSISVNYVFTFLSLLEFDSAETLVLALISVMVQVYWRPKVRPRPIQVFFNLAGISITVTAASFVYTHPITQAAEAQLLRLGLAGGVYYFVNTLSVATVICLSEGRRLKTVFKDVFDWAFGYYLVGVCLAEMVHLSIERVGWTFTIALLPVLYITYRSYRVYMERMEQEKKHVEATAALHLRTIEALAMAIEAKDELTHDHLCRVQVYSLKIAELLGLPEEEVRALHAASILHDIGKLAVPDYIISKPGKLTSEEFEKMKVHTVVGATILEQVGFPYAVAPIVRSHHEKWDGSGYPDGLTGEEIPIGARILSAVDCLDALASDRQYRRAMPLDEAMEYVATLAGRSFDPRIIDVLKEHYREFEAFAKHSPVQEPRLDRNVVVRRGEAPEAGLQTENSARAEVQGHAQAFISSIASARHEVQTILELTQELSGALRLEEMLLLVGERLRQLVPFDCIALYLREDGVLKPRYLHGEGSRHIRRVDIPLGQGVSGWVAENGKPMLNGNPTVEPGYSDDADAGFLRSAISVPLGAEANPSAGALTLYRSEANAYNKDHVRILLAVVDKISRAVESAIRFQEAKREANTDELTGLPNARSLFLRLENEIQRCESAGKRFAVMVCDLDGFKRVNDSFGHLAGNELLRRVARIFEENCRETDYVSRMGGDEFVVMLAGIRPEELERKIDAFDALIRSAGREVCGAETLGVSAGVAYYPDHGSDVEKLLSHADHEMYETKRLRKQNGGKVLQLKRTHGRIAIA